MLKVNREETRTPLYMDWDSTRPDVQSRADVRMVPIDAVGVNEIRMPITLLTKDGDIQNTVANVSMSVALPHDQKGTHMSRFIEIINGQNEQFSLQSIKEILDEIRGRLKANRAQIEVSFPYFMMKKAPVSGAEGLLDYECTLSGESDGVLEDYVLTVKAPVTSLCPCSKEISDYGAHNQRGIMTVEVRSEQSADGMPENIWIEDMVDLAENSGSCPVYPILKRPDERYVTMRAYDNPVFVEDMVRELAIQLKNDARIAMFRARAENLESIHNHNAFAQIEWTRTHN